MVSAGLFAPLRVLIGARGLAASAGKALEWHPLGDAAEATDAVSADRQLATLDTLLQKARGKGRRLDPKRLEIFLADHFTRWLLLPWQEDVAAPEEKHSLACHRFREIYGEAARHWRVTQADVAPGVDTPCCAMDQNLARRVEELAVARGYRLAGLRPLFAAAADHWRPRLPKGLAWFGVIEDDHISLGLLRNRRWLALHAQPLDDASDGEFLAGIMTRRALSVGLEPDVAPLYLCGAGSPGLASPFPGLAVIHLGAALPGLEAPRP